MTATIPSETKSSSRRALLAGAVGGLGALAASAFARPRITQAHDVDDVWLGNPNSSNFETAITNSGDDTTVFSATSTHAGIAIKGTSTSGTGVDGSSTSGIAAAEEALTAHLRSGELPPSFDYHQLEFGGVAAFLAAYVGIEGPAYTLSTACSSSAGPWNPPAPCLPSISVTPWSAGGLTRSAA